MKKLALLFLLACGVLAAQQNRLLVISIDGLDHRWLRDADQLGMKIPTLRELMRRGSRADGVVGISDFLTLLGAWGQTGSAADLDNDGLVGIGDFLLLLGSWG